MGQEKSTFEKIGDYILKSLKLFVKYAFGKSLASLVLGVIAFAFLKLIGVNRAGIIAIIIGVTNVIPLVGPIFAMVVCSIIALFQQPIYGLYVLITSIVLQQFDQWILTPTFVGKSVSLPPLIIIVVILLGGWLFGIPGILLSVPVAAMVRLFYQMFVKKKDGDNKVIDKAVEPDKDESA